MNTEKRKHIEVVAAIICDGNRIFATQRGYGEWKDWWEFPGGKMEPNETPEVALQREIREELATEIFVESLLTTVDYDYPNFHLTIHCYLCKVKNGNLTLLEHEVVKWLTRNELGSVKPKSLSMLISKCFDHYFQFMLRFYIQG